MAPVAGPRAAGSCTGATAIALAAALVGATAGCSLVMPGSAPVADGLTVLAKADGWSSTIARSERFSGHVAVLEVAYDEETARAAWEAAVPAGLAERSGEPVDPGRYGSFADVDLDEQVLVVLSGGQSGSCPGWLGDLWVEDGQVHLEERQHVPGNGCTDDYNDYRLVLAVDRDKVPAQDQLPTEEVLVDGRELSGLVTGYPAG